MVRKERLELSHLTAPEPKSGVSTNSTTSAWLSAWRFCSASTEDDAQCTQGPALPQEACERVVN